MHLADLTLRWSPLNRSFEIRDGELILDTPLRRKVVIYGAGLGKAAAPLDDPAWDVWALNLIPPLDAEGRVRADLWWDLHQRVAQTPDDLRWIAACPRPIFVPPDLLDAGPNCIKFPLAALEKALDVSYWACTFAYQIAFALMAGYTDIGLYGVELSAGTRREMSVEWACVSYWMGFAEARGVRFHLPDGSRLGAHPFRYGFEYQAEVSEVEAYLAKWGVWGALDEIDAYMKKTNGRSIYAADILKQIARQEKAVASGG